MTNPQGKTNLEKYNDAVLRLIDLKKRLSEFKNKYCKSAITIREETLPKQENLVLELEKTKDKAELSKTCKQFLKEWIYRQKYARVKDFSNKYTEKGLLTEQDGFQLIQDQLFKGRMLLKNKEEYEDEYFTGVPDIKIIDFILDNKSSWNLFTFPMGETEISEYDYVYQGRIYLRVAKAENFLICYTLNDIPLEMLQEEFRKFSWNEKLIDPTDQDYYEFSKNYIFTQKGMEEMKKSLFGNADIADFIPIPDDKRFVSFLVEKDIEEENRMIKRVLECREWIQDNYHKF